MAEITRHLHGSATAVSRAGFRQLIALAGLVCMLPAAVHANEPISAERPGFSSSPLTLAPSTWQIESGYQYTRDRDGVDIDDHTLPLLLLRVGLADRLELQLNWPGVSWTEVNDRTSSGGNDASAGIKWQLTPGEVSTPIGLFAGVSLPVGADEFTSDEVDPTLGLFWSHSGAADLFGTVIVTESSGDMVFANGLGASFSLGSQTGGYIEYFGIFPEGSGPGHNINGGITFVPRGDLQLDLHGGLGLNDRAADLFIGFGVAYRL